jgi:hypothetical protein
MAQKAINLAETAPRPVADASLNIGCDLGWNSDLRINFICSANGFFEAAALKL